MAKINNNTSAILYDKALYVLAINVFGLAQHVEPMQNYILLVCVCEFLFLVTVAVDSAVTIAKDYRRKSL